MDDYILEPEYSCEHENSTEIKYMNISIDDMELSVRSYNCLKRAGINNVYELLNKSFEDLKRVRVYMAFHRKEKFYNKSWGE